MSMDFLGGAFRARVKGRPSYTLSSGDTLQKLERVFKGIEGSLSSVNYPLIRHYRSLAMRINLDAKAERDSGQSQTFSNRLYNE